jgi:hypothetical protein
MTEKEFADYGKRLYAITEKGFKVEVIRWVKKTIYWE